MLAVHAYLYMHISCSQTVIARHCPHSEMWDLQMYQTPMHLHINWKSVVVAVVVVQLLQVKFHANNMLAQDSRRWPVASEMLRRTLASC